MDRVSAQHKVDNVLGLRQFSDKNHKTLGSDGLWFELFL